jgi:hypothetical protein
VEWLSDGWIDQVVAHEMARRKAEADRYNDIENANRH